RIILPLYSQNSGDAPYRILCAIGPVGNLSNSFYPMLSTVQLLQRNKYISKHLSIVRDKKCKVIRHLNDTGKLHFKAFQDLDYFSFLTFSLAIVKDVSSHLIAVQSRTDFS